MFCLVQFVHLQSLEIATCLVPPFNISFYTLTPLIRSGSAAFRITAACVSFHLDFTALFLSQQVCL